MSEETINYIEVSVFDGHVESTGLLTHYGMKSRRLRLLTDIIQTNELFDLAFFTITRIIVGKSSIAQDTEEQYIFKKADDDQAMARTVLVNQLKLLEIEGRTTVSGFLTKDTFTNIPEKYKKEPEGISAANIVRSQRAASLGGPIEPKGTTTTGKTSVYNQQTNLAKRNVVTIIAIPRSSNLPSKAFLKKMKAMVKAVSEDKFIQKLPHTAGDEDHEQGVQNDIDAMYDNYGHMNHCGYHGGAYD